MSFERCRKCDERYPGCQDKCEYGIQAKKEYEEKHKIIKKNRDEYIQKRMYTNDFYERMKRKR